MPKENPESITQQKMNESLYGYIHRTDLRLIALQQTVCEFLKLDGKQKETFDKTVESNYQMLLQVSMEHVEQKDSALAARLLDGQNPYSKNV
ncbi:MAG: hypothetical protein QOD03_364 [Verrucomicrobiota bacterium]